MDKVLNIFEAELDCLLNQESFEPSVSTFMISPLWKCLSCENNDTATITTDLIKEIYSFLIYDPTYSYYTNNSQPVDKIAKSINMFKRTTKNHKLVVEYPREAITQELLLKQFEIIQSIVNIPNELKSGIIDKNKFVKDIFAGSSSNINCSICSSKCVHVENANSKTYHFYHKQCLLIYLLKRLQTIYHNEQSGRQAIVNAYRTLGNCHNVGVVNFLIKCPRCDTWILETEIANVLYQEYGQLQLNDLSGEDIQRLESFHQLLIWYKNFIETKLIHLTYWQAQLEWYQLLLLNPINHFLNNFRNINVNTTSKNELELESDYNEFKSKLNKCLKIRNIIDKCNSIWLFIIFPIISIITIVITIMNDNDDINYTGIDAMNIFFSILSMLFTIVDIFYLVKSYKIFESTASKSSKKHYENEYGMQLMRGCGMTQWDSTRIEKKIVHTKLEISFWCQYIYNVNCNFNDGKDIDFFIDHDRDLMNSNNPMAKILAKKVNFASLKLHFVLIICGSFIWLFPIYSMKFNYDFDKSNELHTTTNAAFFYVLATMSIICLIFLMRLCVKPGEIGIIWYASLCISVAICTIFTIMMGFTTLLNKTQAYLPATIFAALHFVNCIALGMSCMF